MNIEFDTIDYQDLKHAVTLLESPSILTRLTSFTGPSMETTLNKLPASVIGMLNNAANAALVKASTLAFKSLGNTPSVAASPRLHQLLAATTGAVGGTLGISALLLELPLSTTVIMRAVADIARSEGFNLTESKTQQYCIEVFALSAETASEHKTDTRYYMTRSFLTQSMQQLGQMITSPTAQTMNRTLSQHRGKWLSAIIHKVTRKFGVVVTHKIVAQSVPVLGALAGASINTLFINFYQARARGHFIVKRLEKKYGAARVKTEYESIVKLSLSQ